MGNRTPKKYFDDKQMFIMGTRGMSGGKPYLVLLEKTIISG